MVNNKIKVLYIASHSRSGSTVIDRVLSQVEDVFTVGEMRHIWERSILENQLCGCSQPFKTCETWRSIIENSEIVINDGFAKQMNEYSRYVDRFKKIPLILNPKLRNKGFNKILEEYKLGVLSVYKSIQKTINSKIIIDSSKNPSYAFILSQIPEIDLHVVHLVRDSRAVAYSRLRRKLRPEIHWKNEYMAITPPYKTALEWNLVNYAIEKLKRYSSYSFIRYEDFINNPSKMVLNILRDMNFSGVDTSYIKNKKIALQIDHTLSGNPMRFKVGDVDLRCDEEWMEKMDKKYVYFMNIFTFPYLKKYKYI